MGFNEFPTVIVRQGVFPGSEIAAYSLPIPLASPFCGYVTVKPFPASYSESLLPGYSPVTPVSDSNTQLFPFAFGIR